MSQLSGGIWCKLPALGATSSCPKNAPGLPPSVTPTPTQLRPSCWLTDVGRPFFPHHHIQSLNGVSGSSPKAYSNVWFKIAILHQSKIIYHISILLQEGFLSICKKLKVAYMRFSKSPWLHSYKVLSSSSNFTKDWAVRHLLKRFTVQSYVLFRSKSHCFQ